MHYQLSLLLASLLAMRSLALPTDMESHLESRQTTINPSGNIVMTFSDATVNIGTAPVSVILDNFSGACATSGLCDTSSIDITGYVRWSQGYNSNTDNGITITIVPGGAYQTWIHNGLIEALSAALQAVAVCSEVTYTYACDTAPHCTTPTQSVTECTMPQFVGITFQDPNAGTAAPSNMEFNTAIETDSDGFCSTFTSIGSAVAGAVNGAAGGIFSLASLICGSS